MQKGIALYLAILIMTIFLAIALGLSAISLSQNKLSRTMGFSVNALSAADAGIEKVLVDRQSPNPGLDFYSGSFSNGATYRVIVAPTGTGGCLAANFCIKSIGDYKETRRAIEISY